jgi:hypothetical protein
LQVCVIIHKNVSVERNGNDEYIHLESHYLSTLCHVE